MAEEEGSIVCPRSGKEHTNDERKEQVLDTIKIADFKG
jgi:hypothetical protein